MAKTFDNISEASATNYLFLFAQRTLALQNEPPTPPPLNALGLPCQAICRLWALLYPEKAAANEYLSAYLKSIGAGATAVSVQEKVALDMKKQAEAAADETLSEEASVQLKAAAAAAADKSHSSEELPGPANEGEDATAVKTVATQVVVAAAGAVVAEDEEAMVKNKKIAERIKPLAEKITEYILDHQDDAAQEERWRTTMKRDMAKSFREQREEAQKVKEEVHAKMDETLQIVKNIAGIVALEA